jgi:hypothetical protein
MRAPWQRENALPSWREVRWTWKRIVLLIIAILSLIDSLFVPMSRNVDPGRSAEGILFLILTFRAASRAAEPPTTVLVCGGCLAALVAALNHRLLISPSWLWTPLALILLAVVMFWGRRRTDKSSSGGAQQRE